MGIKIERKQDGKLEWIQSTLIHSILQDLRLEGEGLKEQPKVRTIPESSTVALINHRGSHYHNPKEFGCRQVIEGWCIGRRSTRPDTTHQCRQNNRETFTGNQRQKYTVLLVQNYGSNQYFYFLKFIWKLNTAHWVSISSTFYALIFCTKVCSKPNSK